MVTSHSFHLIALVVCCSLWSQPSDGSRLYGQPRQATFEAPLAEPGTGGADLDFLFGGPPVQDAGPGMAFRSPARAGNIARQAGVAAGAAGAYGAAQLPPRLPVPPLPPKAQERYSLLDDQDIFRDLLVALQRPGAQAGPDQDQDQDVPGLALEWAGRGRAEGQPRDADQLTQKAKRMGQAATEGKEEEERRKLQRYMAQRRRGAAPEGELKVEKRWWSGRRTGQVDRRDSRNRHYECLRACIREGKLHPIQCHTLC